MDEPRYSCYARIDRIRSNNQRTIMVFLLFVVSLLLALGGGAAALYGADTIRTETGSTLAVAGVAMTCAGLLMFALTACLSELRKIRRLVEAGDTVAPGAQAPFPVAVPPVIAPVTAAAVAAAVVAADRTPPDAAPVPLAPEPEPARPATFAETAPDKDDDKPAPDSPVLRSALLPNAVEEKLDAGIWDPERPAHVPTDVEKSAHDVIPQDAAAQDAAAQDAGAQDAVVQDAFVQDAFVRDAADAAPHDAAPHDAAPHDAPPHDAPPQGADDHGERQTEDRRMEHEETAQPEVPHAQAVTGQAAEARELVATYTSGDNTYFMYSDNAIEAETPQGRFRFASMEELRVFVETGAGGMPLTPPPRRAD
jgi:hypothetical protein